MKRDAKYMREAQARSRARKNQELLALRKKIENPLVKRSIAICFLVESLSLIHI